MQRGFQSGVTIYASMPSNFRMGYGPTVIFVGLLVILYTVIGGSKAVICQI